MSRVLEGGDGTSTLPSPAEETGTRDSLGGKPPFYQAFGGYLMHVATWAFVAARYWQPPTALAPVAPPVVPGADRGRPTGSQAAPRNYSGSPAARQLPLRPEPALVQCKTARRARAS